jgi:hypothetical protein
MAQIIKHRRGSLESVAGATKRAGELLVVTGSSGITAVNGDSILFVGVDGSNVTPANKILQGTTVPNLTGASYDTSVDGVPFYDTDDQKLYILNKGGNVEVKATANTGGTGIISSSAQLPSGLVSESAQVEGIANSQLASSSISIDGTSVSLGGSVTTLQLGTSDSTALAGNTTTITSTQAGHITTNNGKVGYTDALVKLKLDADTVISGSSQVNADSITNFDTNVQAFLRATDVISGSSQVTGLTNTQISGVNHSKIDFGGSELTSGSLGLVIGDGSATDTVNVGVNTLVFAGTANEITTAVTNNQVQIGLPDNVTVGGNMIISGNLTVSGDTVQTNTTTLNVEDNIINVNYGGSATDGGLYVSDVTGGNLTSGSILWDGTNDYWKAGAKDSEARVIVGNGTDTAGKITKFSADGVITDSIISESGTTVTISNDLILSGLTASSFLVSNASKQLVSIASSTDGDFLVSDGSGTYSATNTIDGGTF